MATGRNVNIYLALITDLLRLYLLIGFLLPNEKKFKK